jgi:hypothetical protein
VIDTLKISLSQMFTFITTTSFEVPG